MDGAATTLHLSAGMGDVDIYSRQREALQWSPLPGADGAEEARAAQLSDAIERALPDERYLEPKAARSRRHFYQVRPPLRTGHDSGDGGVPPRMRACHGTMMSRRTTSDAVSSASSHLASDAC